jgi:hypothetical protein
MMATKSTQKLLPWYLNSTLSTEESSEVEAWLDSREATLARVTSLIKLRDIIVQQDVQQPALSVRTYIFTQAQKPARNRVSIFWQWAGGIAFAITIFALLWLVIQPGILIKWDVNSSELSSFRVYRAPNHSPSFEFVSEVKAQPDKFTYSFYDSLLLPTQEYMYIVEGIDQAGRSAAWQTSTSNTTNTLIDQTALIISSIIMAFGMVKLIAERQKTDLDFPIVQFV